MVSGSPKNEARAAGSALNRRHFLQLSTGAAISGLAFGGCGTSGEQPGGATAPSEMQYRPLGNTGLQVSEIAFGAHGVDQPSLMQAALDAGVNTFCTSGSYLDGREEEALGKVIGKLGGRRGDLVLLTGEGIRRGISRRRILEYFDDSLRRLQTDYVDVFYASMVSSPDDLRIDQLFEAFEEAKQAGKVRHLALSSHHRRVFPELMKDGLIDVFHIRYNAAHRGAEKDAFPYIQGENKPGVVSFTATRWGQLLKARKMPPGEMPATAIDCYRFVLSHPTVDVCMVGTKNVEQMRENLKTLELGPMNEEELTRMRKIGDYLYKK